MAPNFHELENDQILNLRNFIPQKKIRFVTATALFDGHDASINIIRRLLQARGAEVIHLGHNRTAKEVVSAAIQEDAHGVALSSYQGGHVEYFSYVRKLLDEQGGQKIKIFGGGGGVISPSEISKLESEGISKIFSPEDGQVLGLDGMIGYMLQVAHFSYDDWDSSLKSQDAKLSRALTLLENGMPLSDLVQKVNSTAKKPEEIPVLGVTGTGGAGKSSLLDELLLRFLFDFPKLRIGLICVDPSKKISGGALLGDRIRINSCDSERIFVRSFASRGSGQELAKITGDAVKLLKQAGFDLVIVETSGIGQGDTGILSVSDYSLYVMTPEYGAATQLEKIDMLDFADFIAINKFERRQGPDALRDIRTTLRRNRFKGLPPKDGNYPVYGTIASRFNDDGISGLYKAIVKRLEKYNTNWEGSLNSERIYAVESTKRDALIPSDREHYLGEIAKTVRDYKNWVNEQVALVASYENLNHAAKQLAKEDKNEAALECDKSAKTVWQAIDSSLRQMLAEWKGLSEQYNHDEFIYYVRNKPISVASKFVTLAQQKIPRVATPKFISQADLTKWLLLENLPGRFPYTAGLFPFRRTGEDPKRQFAGEGGPGRTNKRFHYLCKNDPAKRLSTAFDSVTLYGSNPDKRPDIYGKIGESGVSIAHLDDMKMLYSGFDLCDPSTSVSMTINGPAPIILAMFLNTAIDQQIEKFVQTKGYLPNPNEHQEIYDKTLQTVRGTVQADILKEDQAQNTCIFSTEFALKMMGDIQEYFIEKKVRNYYGVSISGYHIAEAGANPITQLAFTLANGFTYVEYYLARGFAIDDFAPNLSFFFSNGLDTEYTVLGRVARRIWAIALKKLYGANERSQQLKYHIQTSGRSLHAQEMDFNDIRTTLQALIALVDNCNSLHTNAFDEALTTPTEASVRRAMAIQMIINKELGLNKCENFHQGSFFIEELHELVEEAVLKEFESLSHRGGVLGAMETQYQRSKIQEESLYYEHLKHTGELPIIGVNTFQNPNAAKGLAGREEVELIRSSYEEKDDQLSRLHSFKSMHQNESARALQKLCEVIISGGNIFAELMHTVRHCSLGEISEALFQVGGRYRRSM